MIPALLVGWIVLCGAFAVECRADEESSAGVGLVGINDMFPPRELNTEFLSDDFMEQNYPESWQKWATELDEELIGYFDPSELDVKGQRELIDKLRIRVATMNRALGDPRYTPIHEKLYTLAVPLENHLNVSAAILDTLEEGITPVSEAKRKEAFSFLKETTAELESFLSARENGGDWIGYFEIPELRKQLADMNTPTAGFAERLKAIRGRLENEKDYNGEQLRLLRTNAFWAFRRAVAQVDSILAWEQTPPTVKTLRDNLRSLSYACTNLDRLTLLEHGRALQLAWDQLDLLNANAGKRFAFLHERFYGDNVRAYIAEEVFDDALGETRTDTEPINEVSSSGATITGTNTTTTVISLDLVPSPEEALMAVKAKGDIESHAVAEMCCIKVFTYGKSQFWAEKRANFDGYRFLPFGATISVNAMNIPYAAESTLSCLPLAGPCFDRMVLNQANAQRPQTEADIRQKIANRVVPELNREINNTLADANQDLDDRYARLSRNNLYPVLMRTATTDTHFLSQSLVRDMVDLGGGRPPVIFNQPTGANFHIHESLLNNIADRMDIAGRTMTEDEFRAEVSRFLTDLTGAEFDFSKEADPKPRKEQNLFVFDKLSPIRFQIRDGQIEANLRMGLLRPGGEEIPAHDVTIPMKYKLEGDKILILIDPDTLPIGRADGMSKAEESRGMRLAIKPAIKDSERSRFFNLNFQSGKSLTLRTEQIKAVNGWLSIWAIPVENAPMETMPTTPGPVDDQK